MILQEAVLPARTSSCCLLYPSGMRSRKNWLVLSSVQPQLDGRVCRAAAKAWPPPRSIPPREKSAVLEALQSGRDTLTLLFGSPFALPSGEVMTGDDKGAADARQCRAVLCTWAGAQQCGKAFSSRPLHLQFEFNPVS